MIGGMNDDLKDMVWCLVYAIEWSKTGSTSKASMDADRAISGMLPPLHSRTAAQMREAEEVGRKMYIVTDEVDYESTTIVSALVSELDAIKAAEAHVGTYMDPCDVPKARQDLNNGFWSMGPATEALAVWRCYDRSTIAVYRLRVADAPSEAQPPGDGRREDRPDR